jgi:diguanylate cyclase (GGDEF)-like protein
MVQSLKWIYLRHLLVVCVSLCLLGYGVWGLAVDALTQPDGPISSHIASPAVVPDSMAAPSSPAATAVDKTSGTMRLLYIALIIASMLMIITSTSSLYVRSVHYVRHDIDSLVRMFHDIHDGHIRVDYPMLLREFSGIFRFLRSSGTQMMEEKRQFKEMGLIDHLSQLNNRRHFEKRLEDLFNNAKLNGPSSVLIIDVDHFKRVNDEHGHDVGDALIVGFADAMRKVVRKTDILARLGGDEFCIIYTYTGLDKARELVERLRRELPRHIQLPKGLVHTLRWTGGLSAMHNGDKKFDAVLWRADQALLEAKENGRNNTRVYPNPRPLAKKRLQYVN